MSYLIDLTGRTFDFHPLSRELSSLIKSSSADATLADQTMNDIPHQISDAITAQTVNTIKYREQLRGLLETDKREEFLDRLSKGMEYYSKLLLDQRKILVKHILLATAAKRGKRYMNDLKDLDQMLGQYWLQVTKVHALANGIVNGHETFDFTAAQKTHEQAREALAVAISQVPVKKKKGKKKKKKASTEEDDPA